MCIDRLPRLASTLALRALSPICVFVLLIAGPAIFAQTERTSITGTVTDSTRPRFPTPT